MPEYVTERPESEGETAAVGYQTLLRGRTPTQSETPYIACMLRGHIMYVRGSYHVY